MDSEWDRQINRNCIAECAQIPDCVCGREQGRVCICLFALVCLWIRVSCVWLCSLCVLTHVCLYVPCRYHSAEAKLSNPKSDSLYSTLCDILPFIFPLCLKRKSLPSLAQFSPLDVSLVKYLSAVSFTVFICSTGVRVSSIVLCFDMQESHIQCVCTSSKNTLSQQFSILFLPLTSFWKLSSLLTVLFYLSLPVAGCDIWLLSSLVHIKQKFDRPSSVLAKITDTEMPPEWAEPPQQRRDLIS